MHDGRNVVRTELTFLGKEGSYFSRLRLFALGLHLSRVLVLLLASKDRDELRERLYPLIRRLLQFGDLQIVMLYLGLALLVLAQSALDLHDQLGGGQGHLRRRRRHR